MPVRFDQRRLANGLTIVAEPDGLAHSASVGFFVRTGGRDEPRELMGVSHFLEHMMFKGTAELSAEALNRRYDELGARNNAYTSHEVTCFYATVTPERFLPAVELTAAMMRPALRQSDFDTEKGVILEEIAMYDDNPFWVLYERTSEAYYAGHPLGHRVLGTKQTITDLTREQMAGYFGRRYAADTTVVALAGRMDLDAVCERIGALCGGWPGSAGAAVRAAPRTASERVELDDERFDRGYLLLLSPGPGAQDEDRYAATLAAQVLGASDNSRLHWTLIETGLAEEAQAGYEANDGSGEFMIYASGDPQALEAIEEAAVRAADELAGSLTEDDLARLRSRFATAFTVSAERPSDRMQRLGRRWSALGEYRSLEDELERIRSVRLEDVRRVLSRFPLERRTVGRLRPPPSA